MTQTTERPAESATSAGGASAAGPRRAWWRPSWPTLLLALIAYVPLLASAPGKVGADTKAYLYLDPGRLLSRAVSMWDPHTGMGTVTHQVIGYLWPQGPWYWLFDQLGVPTWIAQRLWTGSILFAAGTGVLYLMRTFGWRDRAATLAALPYMLAPYVLQHEARTSALLLPYAGLGWMTGLAVRALRSPRGWRYPALFALIVATIGGTNATSLIYAALAPLVWLLFALFTREVSGRNALKVLGRTALLTLLTNLWWMAGLVTQSHYGLDVLRYTETIKTVSSTNHPLEILRGLGMWYFYGRDLVSPWIEASVPYRVDPGLLAVSFAVPLAAFIAAVSVRWRHRGFFIALIALGMLIGVGLHPYSHPSPAGSVVKGTAETSNLALALRSTPRAAPMVVLGLAVLLAAGLEALWVRRATQRAERPAAASAVRMPRPRRWTGGPAWLAPAATVVVLVLVAANITPLWTGGFLDSHLEGPQSPPAYWQQAAAYLDQQGSSSRVLELPGQDFAQYRWGATGDPVTPGIMDRPWAGRQADPIGMPSSVALVQAIDRRMQEGVFEPSGLADLARMMGVGDVLLRSDLQYERYRTPRPRALWSQLDQGIPGFDPPKTFGPPVAETPSFPYQDEITVGTPATVPNPPAVAVFPVSSSAQILRAESPTQPLVVDGDAEGLVDAADAGLLQGVGSAGSGQPGGTVLFSADQTPAQLQQALANGAALVVTDSNRQRAERWGILRENYGYTEGPNEYPLVSDPSDARLPVFPDETQADQTISLVDGMQAVSATAYGTPLSYIPGERPFQAIDGNLDTAWRVGAFADVRGERLRLDLNAPVVTDHLTLVQPQTGPRNRWLTRVGLVINGGPEQSVDLTNDSLQASGQVVHFPAQAVRSVQIVLHDTNLGVRADYAGVSGVGFAEVKVGDLPSATETLRLPTDLLTAAGPQSLQHPLVFVMARDRADPGDAVKPDGELDMNRTFDLPTTRQFRLDGTVRLSAAASEQLMNQLVREPAGYATSDSDRLPGSLTSSAFAAFDGNPNTSWATGFSPEPGQWVELTTPNPAPVDRLKLQVVADGRHSVPDVVRLDVDGRTVGRWTLPDLSGITGAPGATQTVPLTFPATTGHTFRLTVESVRPRSVIDIFSHQPHALPVALAEVGLSGGGKPITIPPLPAQLSSGCRSDLLTVDGKPVPVQVSGKTSDALARQGLSVTECGAPLSLNAGRHVVRTAWGKNTGLDLDRLVLSSAAGGGAAHDPSSAVAAPAAARSAPTVQVVKSSDTSFTARVTGATPGQPFNLVLAQSYNLGWHASVAGHALGDPRLVDGFANGWVVNPTSASFTVQLDWTPQRAVDIALIVSAVAGLLCLLILLASRLRRRAAFVPPAARPGDAEVSLVAPWHAAVPAGRLRGRRGRLVLAVAVLGAGVAVFVQPLVGVAAVVAAVLALTLRRGRAIVRLAAVAILALDVLYVLQLQVRYRFPADFGWVEPFEWMVPYAWLPVVLLVTDALVGWLSGRDGPGD